MNLLNKPFGATGKISIDFDAAGLHVVASDSEKLTDQSVNVTVKPAILIDELVGLVGAPSWLVGVATFLKAELATLGG